MLRASRPRATLAAGRRGESSTAFSAAVNARARSPQPSHAWLSASHSARRQDARSEALDLGDRFGIAADVAHHANPAKCQEAGRRVRPAPRRTLEELVMLAGCSEDLSLGHQHLDVLRREARAVWISSAARRCSLHDGKRAQRPPRPGRRRAEARRLIEQDWAIEFASAANAAPPASFQTPPTRGMLSSTVGTPAQPPLLGRLNQGTRVSEVVVLNFRRERNRLLQVGRARWASDVSAYAEARLACRRPRRARQRAPG